MVVVKKGLRGKAMQRGLKRKPPQEEDIEVCFKYSVQFFCCSYLQGKKMILTTNLKRRSLYSRNLAMKMKEGMIPIKK